MPAQPSASGVRVGTIDDWCALVRGDAEALIEGVTPDPAPADVARWRKSWPAGLVSAAIELARARVKAQKKFPTEVASALIADVPGIEMASTALASAHVAERFKAAGAETVFDLASGIGADAMALERVMPGAVNAIELDPIRAMMTEKNAKCHALCADATATKIPPPPPCILTPLDETAAGGGCGLSRT